MTLLNISLPGGYSLVSTPKLSLGLHSLCHQESNIILALRGVKEAVLSEMDSLARSNLGCSFPGVAELRYIY